MGEVERQGAWPCLEMSARWEGYTRLARQTNREKGNQEGALKTAPTNQRQNKPACRKVANNQ